MNHKYLRSSIRHCSHHNSKRKHRHAEDLHLCVPFSPDESHDHGSYASPTSQNDVHRHRYIVAECEVIEDVDTEENDYVGEPAGKGYGAWFQEEGWVRGRKMGGPGEEGREEKLDEGYKETWDC